MGLSLPDQLVGSFHHIRLLSEVVVMKWPRPCTPSSSRPCFSALWGRLVAGPSDSFSPSENVRDWARGEQPRPFEIQGSLHVHGFSALCIPDPGRERFEDSLIRVNLLEYSGEDVSVA
jgi:hypothetical protein